MNWTPGAATRPANPLVEYYAPIRFEVERLAGTSWPSLDREIRRHLTDCRLPTSVTLPLAACAAAGGDPERAVSTAACAALLHLSVRWFDDLEDRDRHDGLWRELGVERATNFAAATLSLASQALAEDPDLPRAVQTELAQACVATARGQDLDLRSAATTMEAYWQLVDGKTGAGFAFAARAGGLIAGADETRLNALAQFGIHWGRLVQMLDDLEGVFQTPGDGDLSSGKITLPLLYGLSHVDVRGELRAMIEEGRLEDRARVREVLDRSGARDFVVWAALEQRGLAFSRLDVAVDPAGPFATAGREMLAVVVDSMFCGLERLVGEES